MTRTVERVRRDEKVNVVTGRGGGRNSASERAHKWKD